MKAFGSKTKESVRLLELGRPATQPATSARGVDLPKFIILNTKSINLNEKSIILNTKLHTADGSS